ncbi:MAG: hypothetical protein LBQ81_09430 [Zoogloeaceae bacterium]|jgi:hypothetical protein|nr:hypothetical protein [Zoogloeaceae bacterium]
MLNFSSFWFNYLDYCQRSWLEMTRLWMPSIPTPFFGARESGVGSGAYSGGQSGLLEAFSSGAWLSALTPWMPRVEANIEPFVTDASAGQAETARVSMRIFMPWGGEPFWVEALVGQHRPRSFARQESPLSIADHAVHEVIPRNP